VAARLHSRSNHVGNGISCISCRLFPAPGLPAGVLCVVRGSAFPAVAFPIEYITNKKQNIMQSLNRNGVSITQAPGEEKFVKYRPVAFKGRIFYQYDYRHTDGELFSTVAKTLAECRHRRDKWIEKKEQGNNR
jgi:hypothetical protein